MCCVGRTQPSLTKVGHARANQVVEEHDCSATNIVFRIKVIISDIIALYNLVAKRTSTSQVKLYSSLKSHKLAFCCRVSFISSKSAATHFANPWSPDLSDLLYVCEPPIVGKTSHMSSSPPLLPTSSITFRTSSSSNMGPMPSHRAIFFRRSQTSPISTAPER